MKKIILIPLILLNRPNFNLQEGMPIFHCAYSIFKDTLKSFDDFKNKQKVYL